MRFKIRKKVRGKKEKKRKKKKEKRSNAVTRSRPRGHRPSRGGVLDYFPTLSPSF